MAKSKVINTLLVLPILVLAVLNLIQVFTPELGFDALWYHLTLPKLWLMKGQWYFEGGLLYYSVMPRLSETVFIPFLYFFGTSGPKMIQYLAGVGVIWIMWKIGGLLKLSRTSKLISISLFYCTWLVSWQSSSAYIDLIRTFLETTALYYLLTSRWKLGGVFLGLAIGTKWLSLTSLAIYSVIFGYHIVFPALLIASPWFLIAYFYTGNPIYPIFSGIIDNSIVPISTAIKNILLSPVALTIPYDDFLSPVVGIVFVVSLINTRSDNPFIKRISLIGVIGSLTSLVLDPPSSRFALPFLPAMAISGSYFVQSIVSVRLKSIAMLLITISSFFILGSRLYSFKKYLPYLAGSISEREFLAGQYHRLPGTFIDVDGFVEKLPDNKKILVDKLHNLYYFPRNFDHTSWVRDRSGYDYLVTMGEEIGEYELVHTNSLGIQVYKLQ